jgi:hypothetical protein
MPLLLPLVLLLSLANPPLNAVTVCDPEEVALFICETNRHEKYVAICATEVETDRRWTNIQYRFGPEKNAEFVYPSNAATGATSLLFSHQVRGSVYDVFVRFRSGGYTYLIHSSGDAESDPPGDGDAGVKVTNLAGKVVASIACIERPTMFAEYLRLALACDPENAHGKAGCAKSPPDVKVR